MNPRGNGPVPDWDKVRRADEPRLREPVPAISLPVDNANQTIDKVSMTINRAGTSPSNPVLQGLGVRSTFAVHTSGRPLGLWLYQDRSSLGPNRIGDLISLAPGIYAYDFVAGSGGSVAGTSATGARRNFIRLGEEHGSEDREFYCKHYDRDVVSIAGQAALDEALSPVAVQVSRVDPAAAWLEVPIDFMPSWSDEFHAAHRSTASQRELGFLKAYGGAKCVSVYDTDPGTEGVGVQCDPINQTPVENLRSVRVQNSPGVKALRFRFRSKQDSIHKVDVDVLIEVLDAVIPTCQPPILELCKDTLLLAGTPLPANTPDVPSIPAVQVVAGVVGTPLAQDLFYPNVVCKAKTSGAVLRVRRWALTEREKGLQGVRVDPVGDPDDYLPLRLAAFGASPPGYQDPEIFCIALSVAAETAAGTAYLTLSAVENGMESNAILFQGPRARAACSMPAGGAGGGDACCGPDGCVAQFVGGG